jgi:anaerobic ribonucleoside-triphosphate reductase activating protein
MSHVAYPVTALGPGRRVALWVSGCRLRCKNCITPELLDPKAGKKVAVTNVVERLVHLPQSLEGITLTGGEPFDQSDALASVVQSVRERRSDWSVLAFSGYPLKSLRRAGSAQRRLLDYVDILIAGPYVQSLASVHPLAASSNQQVHYLSARGRELQTECARLPFNHANIGMGRSGPDWLIGILSKPVRTSVHGQLELTVTEAISTGCRGDG